MTHSPHVQPPAAIVAATALLINSCISGASVLVALGAIVGTGVTVSVLVGVLLGVHVAVSVGNGVEVGSTVGATVGKVGT